MLMQKMYIKLEMKTKKVRKKVSYGNGNPERALEMNDAEALGAVLFCWNWKQNCCSKPLDECNLIPTYIHEFKNAGFIFFKVLAWPKKLITPGTKHILWTKLTLS